MRAYCLLIWIFLEQTKAYEHILYVNGIPEESVTISCQSKHQPTAFSLSRGAAEPEERELVVYVHEGKVTNDPKYEGRIKISGLPSLTTVNITLLNVKTTDAGLYNCTFMRTEHQPFMRTEHLLKIEQILILLLVKNKDADCSCPGQYSVIYSISVAVLLLFLILITLCTAYHRKVSSHDKCTAVSPVYEAMSTAQPTCESSNPFTAQTDPAATEPIYALPKRAETHECHYEVPKKLNSNALMEEINPELTAEID